MSRNHGRCPMKTRAIVFSLIMILVSVAGCAGGQDEASLNEQIDDLEGEFCLLYTSPSPRDRTRSRMPSSA